MSQTKRTRKHYPTSQKAELLRRHLVDKIPVSDLCNELGLQPSVFYAWQQQLFANAGAALENPHSVPRREQQLQAQVEQLQARLVKKDQVIAQVTEELVGLKKELGEP